MLPLNYKNYKQRYNYIIFYLSMRLCKQQTEEGFLLFPSLPPLYNIRTQNQTLQLKLDGLFPSRNLQKYESCRYKPNNPYLYSYIFNKPHEPLYI